MGRFDWLSGSGCLQPKRPQDARSLGWGKAVDPLEHDGNRTLVINHGSYALRAVDLRPARGSRVEACIDPSLISLERQNDRIRFLSHSPKQNQPPMSFG